MDEIPQASTPARSQMRQSRNKAHVPRGTKGSTSSPPITNRDHATNSGSTP